MSLWMSSATFVFSALICSSTWPFIQFVISERRYVCGHWVRIVSSARALKSCSLLLWVPFTGWHKMLLSVEFCKEWSSKVTDINIFKTPAMEILVQIISNFTIDFVQKVRAQRRCCAPDTLSLTFNPPPPWNLQSLTSLILLEMKQICYFSYLFTSTVIRQTEPNFKTSIQEGVMGYFLLLVGTPPPPRKHFLDPRLCN